MDESPGKMGLRDIFTYSFLICLLFLSCKTPKERAVSANSSPVTAQENQPNDQPAVEDEISQQGDIESLILGDWEWEKTICCGRTPFTKTSDSLEVPNVLKFQKGGALLYLSGNQVTGSDSYTISYGLLNNERPLINIGKSQRSGIINIKDDQLIIDYGYMDLQTEYYVRRK